jgi:hypothetical protein
MISTPKKKNHQLQRHNPPRVKTKTQISQITKDLNFSVYVLKVSSIVPKLKTA